VNLVHETVHEFKRIGFADTEIAVVTARAGVSRGAFYVHFAGKDDILREILFAEEQRIAREVRPLVHQGRPLEDVLQAIVDATLRAERRLGRRLIRDLCAAQFRPEFSRGGGLTDHRSRRCCSKPSIVSRSRWERSTSPRSSSRDCSGCSPPEKHRRSSGGTTSTCSSTSSRRGQQLDDDSPPPPAVGCAPVGETTMIDLIDPAVYANGFPHDLFVTLRAEAPVYWHPFDDRVPDSREAGIWVLSRHSDVEAVNRDVERFSALDGPSLA
jgi:hypothetical protein